MFLAPSAALLLLLYINLRMASPVLAIPIRWLRWILFALLAARQISEAAGLTGRSGCCRLRLFCSGSWSNPASTG